MSRRILCGALLNEDLDVAAGSEFPASPRRWGALRMIFSVRPETRQVWVYGVWFLTWVESFYPMSLFSEWNHKLLSFLVGLCGLKKLTVSNSVLPGVPSSFKDWTFTPQLFLWFLDPGDMNAVGAYEYWTLTHTVDCSGSPEAMRCASHFSYLPWIVWLLVWVESPDFDGFAFGRVACHPQRHHRLDALLLPLRMDVFAFWQLLHIYIPKSRVPWSYTSAWEELKALSDAIGWVVFFNAALIHWAPLFDIWQSILH